ncbi:MAG: ACP S-malonyltransferase [Clostridiales bacterium]|jgi:[acyl-carrier-protein] S-malonyltransferase|nr:ACP S-malonyltransferase [Clostridiales bacterium]
MKTAFIFSGQGAQYYNMGKDLYGNFSCVRDTVEEANTVLDFDIKEICFRQNEKLNITEYTQPAILVFSIAFFRLLTQNGINAGYYAGLSLGEYSALTAAGAFDFKDAVQLVRKRGKFMQGAVPEGSGGMTAVMGASREIIEEVCREASADGIVAPANYNMPGQIVIAGTIKALESAENLLKGRGIRRFIRLKVSGPFHTPLLKPAADKLNSELKKINIYDMRKPVITNLTGTEIKDKSGIIDTLTKQVVSPVYWEEGINYLINKGVGCFVEVGPGKALSSFIKKINKGAITYNIEDMQSFEEILERLG